MDIGKKVGDVAKKALKAVLKLIGWKVIAIIAIIVILLGAFVLLIDKVIVETSAEAAQGSISAGTSIENNQIKIEDSVYDDILNALKAQGIDPYSLYLDPSQGYIQKYIQAETVTSYPKMGTEGMQGIINFIRKDATAAAGSPGTQMTYMPYDEFNNIVNQQSSSAFNQIKNCFTIDMSTMDAIVATYTSVSGSESMYSISTQRIPYKNQVAKYTMPFEFLIALLRVSQNPEFVVSLADMVINNSKIDYTIQDCISNITTTEIYEYDEVTVTTEYDDQGNVTGTTTNTEHKEETTSVTREINSILPYISEVDTWIVNIIQTYDKSVRDINESQTQTLSDEQVSSNVKRVNRKTTTTETGQVITFVGGVTTSGSAADIVDSSQFTGNVSAVGKVATMMNWAHQQVGKTQYKGMTGTCIAKNMCSRFVSNCYWAAGFTYLGGNANSMGNLGTHYSIKRDGNGKIDYSDIPLGACLVSLKGTYGHVAIYVGNGYIIEAGVNPIRKIHIDKAWKSDSYAYWALGKELEEYMNSDEYKSL